MTPSQSPAPINSLAWWEDYFQHHWDSNQGGAQTAHFMERLIASLPDAERRFLEAGGVSMLDWGCAFGEGVRLLSTAFPQASVVGLDFSSEAIQEAVRRHPGQEFLHTDDGCIPRAFDVIVTSNCLEHFDDPLSVVRSHLPHCRQLYMVLVPYRESPLCECHRAQFREECFPMRVDGFSRLHCAPLAVDPAFWNGQQLLVVYASAEYLALRQRSLDPAEREKWDDYYNAIEPALPDEVTAAFGQELADRIAELLPEGGRVLEAGCGSGWQSLALARKGKYQVTLLDFSRAALRQAEQLFAREGLQAEFICQDALTPEKADYDLVFNAGVLEHYRFEDQVRFLRAMAGRSRRYVLALVPNRHCYWYWMWRIRTMANAAWPYGKEVPMGDLSRAFEAAGMRHAGNWFCGGSWSQDFIAHLPGLGDELKQQLLAVHRSGLLSQKQTSYLVAALGTREASVSVPACWELPSASEDFSFCELSASLADSLSTIVARDRHVHELSAKLQGLESQLADHRSQREKLIAKVEKFQVHMASKEAEPVERQDTDSTAEIASVQQALREARSEAQRKSHEIAALKTRLAGERASIEQSLAAGEAAQQRLAAITSCQGWTLLTILWKIRLALAPRDSLRERAARASLRGVRRVRAGGRRLTIAAARPFFRRLPVAWRYRLKARWAGWSTPAIAAPAAVDRLHSTEPGPSLVSIVLPVYNQASLVRESIESVLAQTYRDWELILVNDGSTDGVEDVLAEYSAHPQIRILTQANQKLPKALSNGFELAGGELWTWTSADNRMHPDHLARQVAFLRSHPAAAMVYADYLAIDDRGQPLEDLTFRPHNRHSPDSPEIHLPRSTERLNAVQDNFIGPCFLYRGWVGRLLGEYDPNLGVEDYDYWMRLNAAFRIEHLGTDETLYEYRVHDNSLSGRAAELKILQRVQRLMTYEVERAEYFGRAWTVHADAATLSWLHRVESYPHRVVAWSDKRPAIDDGGKHLFLVSGESLTAVADLNLPPATQVAVWYAEGAGGSGPAAPYVDRVELARTRAAAFSPDGQIAARLELCAGNSFHVALGEPLYQLAVKQANLRAFYEATRPESLRRRDPPRVFQAAGKRLRVLIQVDDFTQGGMEQVVLDLLATLDRREFQLSLLVLGRQGSAVEAAREAGVRVVTLASDRSADEYRRLLADEQIDLVNAHYSLFGAGAASELDVPFVQTIHNTYVWLSPSEIAAYRANDRHTTAYVCVSQNVARYSDVKLGLPIAKLVVVPNGIDLSRFGGPRSVAVRSKLRNELGLADEDFVFLNVASVHATKAQRALAKALAEVAGEHPQAKAVVAGRAMDASYRGEIERLLRNRGLEKSFLLAGHREDVADMYSMADAFILPSFWEGWSLALAEAVACGLPILATDVGAAREVIHEVGGRLVQPPFAAITDLDVTTLPQYLAADDPGFVRDLAGAMREVCLHPEPPRLSAAVRRSMDRGQAYQGYAHLFQWLIAGGSPQTARAWTRWKYTLQSDAADARESVAA